MQAKNSTKECNLPVLYRLQAELLATVQPGKIATEHNSQDIYHVICLTLRNLPPSHLLVDQPAQLAQPIGAEQGATSADRDYEIGLVDIVHSTGSVRSRPLASRYETRSPPQLLRTATTSKV